VTAVAFVIIPIVELLFITKNQCLY